ncbi:MAG: Fe-S cluster assembly protein SufD [Chloroflexi bacterium]|nr:Fe-S cluster assembly protein SufD [Chloroflexota bacterium]
MSEKTLTTTTPTPTQEAGFHREAVEALSAWRQDPNWMREFRLLAWRFYEEIPFPTQKDEAWRRTSLRGLDLSRVLPMRAERLAPVSRPEDLPEALRSHLAASEERAGLLIHQDGDLRFRTLREDLAQRGVIFTDMDTAVREYADLVQPYFMTEAVPVDSNKFAALHAAFWQGGVFLYVPRNTQVDLPLQAIAAREASGAGHFSHTLIVVEEGAEVTYIEDYLSLASGDQGLHSGVVEIYVKPGGRLTYINLQDWAQDMWNFSTQHALLERDSSLLWIAGNMGSRLTKTFARLALRGPGANGEMLGITFADDRQHIDLDTFQDHIAPQGTSNLLYKNVLKDRARTVWRGMIWAHPEAQKTNAYQKNENLLLSDHTRADSIPGLEIEANDLRCTHGATAGKLNPDHMFYLMSRGLSREQAKRIIVEGFFEPLLTRIPVESIRARMERAVMEKLAS